MTATGARQPRTRSSCTTRSSSPRAGGSSHRRAGLDGARASFAPGAAEPSVPDGRIHHWAGAVFIPGVTLDHVLRYLQDRAGRESEAFDDVRELEAASPATATGCAIYMKLRRESVITVTYNTEHAVEYRRLGETRASSRSVATKIAELDGAGTPQEREKPAGSDHGFLWRLNAYWRYEQVNGGVLIECESVSLSRGVPVLLRVVGEPHGRRHRQGVTAENARQPAHRAGAFAPGHSSTPARTVAQTPFTEPRASSRSRCRPLPDRG